MNSEVAPLSIAVLTPTFLPIVGGAEVGIHEIYSRIGQFHDVTVLTPRETLTNNRFTVSEAEAGHEYETIRYSNPFMRLPKGPVRSFLVGLCLPEAWQLWRLKRRRHVDVVNVHFAKPFGLITLFLRHVLRVPAVLSLVGRTDVWTELGRVGQWHLLATSRNSARTTEITPFCLEASPISGTATVVPYGVDLASYSPGMRSASLRQSLGVRPEDVLVFSVQRLAKIKRVDQILLIAKRLEASLTSRGGRYIFIIAGKGEEWDALTLEMQRSAVSNVKLVGFVPDREMPAYFASADIFISHSMFETFGVTFAQAMASGVPIVAARTSCVPMVVDDAVDGFLVEPFDISGFATAIGRIGEDLDLAQSLADGGHRHAHREYGWDRIATNTLEVLAEVSRDGT